MLYPNRESIPALLNLKVIPSLMSLQISKPADQRSGGTSAPMPETMDLVQPSKICPPLPFGCHFCVRDHPDHYCPEVMLPEQRAMFYRQWNICDRCFGPTHQGQCARPVECLYCLKSDHGSALCTSPNAVIHRNVIQVQASRNKKNL